MDLMRKQNQQIMYVHACHLINMLIRLCQGCYILLVFMCFLLFCLITYSTVVINFYEGLGTGNCQLDFVRFISLITRAADTLLFSRSAGPLTCRGAVSWRPSGEWCYCVPHSGLFYTTVDRQQGNWWWAFSTHCVWLTGLVSTTVDRWCRNSAWDKKVGFFRKSAGVIAVDILLEKLLYLLFYNSLKMLTAI